MMDLFNVLRIVGLAVLILVGAAITIKYFITPVLQIIRIWRVDVPAAYGFAEGVDASAIPWRRVHNVYINGDSGDWFRDIFQFIRFRGQRMAATDLGVAFSLFGVKFLVPWEDLGPPERLGWHLGRFTVSKVPIRIALTNKTVRWLVESSQGRWKLDESEPTNLTTRDDLQKPHPSESLSQNA